MIPNPQPSFVIAVNPRQVVQPNQSVADIYTLTNATHHHTQSILGLYATATYMTQNSSAPLPFTLALAGLKAHDNTTLNTTYNDPSLLQAALETVDWRKEHIGVPITIAIVYQMPVGAANGETVVTELGAILTADDSSYAGDAMMIDVALATPSFQITATPAAKAQPGSSVADIFTLTNTTGSDVIAPSGSLPQAASGNFLMASDAVIYAPNPNIPVIVAPTYVLTLPTGVSSQPMPLSALQKALSQNAIAPGQFMTIAVQYTVPDVDDRQHIVTQLTASLSALSATTPAQTATAVDLVSAKPTLSVTPTPGAPPQVVTPGMNATDSFTLTNGSGQFGTISLVSIALTDTTSAPPAPFGMSQFTAFSLNGTAIVPDTNTTPFAALVQAVSALAPTPDQGSITITATYAVPQSKVNDNLADTLTAYITAGNLQGPNVPGTVNDTVGAFDDELKQLVDQLYAMSQKKGTLDPAVVQPLLNQAEAEAAAFVNGSPDITVSPQLFARSIAAHNLVDTLYDRLLAQEQPPVQLSGVI